jgi:hypothetical protein
MRQARATSSSSPTRPRSTPRAAARSATSAWPATRHHRDPDRRHDQTDRRPPRPPRQARPRHAQDRRHARSRSRQRAPRRDPPQPQRDPPAAPRPARRARRSRRPEGLARRARPPALRLLAHQAAHPRAAPGDRAPGQRHDPPQPRSDTRELSMPDGQGRRRDRPVRGQVRRGRPRREDRRRERRAVRRHPRRARRRHRPVRDRQRGGHRPGRAPHRGRHRHGRSSHLQQTSQVLAEAASELHAAGPHEVLAKLGRLFTDLRARDREISELQRKLVVGGGGAGDSTTKRSMASSCWPSS